MGVLDSEKRPGPILILLVDLDLEAVLTLKLLHEVRVADVLTERGDHGVHQSVSLRKSM